MSEMLERVALAISGSDDPSQVLAVHRVRARAAIEAMREPTEAMKAAGSNATVLNDLDTMTDVVGAGHAWRAMIDAVLKE